jgi:hypothetical protein
MTTYRTPLVFLAEHELRRDLPGTVCLGGSERVVDVDAGHQRVQSGLL